MKHLAWWALAAGALPIAAVGGAFCINLASGFEACNPLLEGCTSVSRAVRSGPGLWLFKAAALPSGVCMTLSWWGLAQILRGVGAPRRAAWVAALGGTAAVFFVVYAAALGSEGVVYGWMRRYGVVLYFGGCGLAQLLVAAWLSHAGRLGQGWHSAAARAFIGVVGISWLLGVVSASRRRLVDDPALQDRLQNALEWHFSLCLSLGFLALAWWLSTQSSDAVSSKPEPGSAHEGET